MAESVRELIAEATRELSDAGVASPRVDAELIAAHVLDTERGRIFTYENFSPAQANSFKSYVDTRCSHVPVQYIIGVAPFRYLEVEVGPGVLIPRPETELVAQHAIDTVKSMSGTPVVVDLGSGSGAIALAIATEAPHSRVLAVERESSAFVWLKRNVASLAPTIECKQADVADALQDLDGQVDIAVANPPYVNSHSEMPFEVSNFEPAEALFGGGEAGIEIPGIFAKAASRLLKQGGTFICEHGEDQGAAIANLLSRDFIDIILHTDFNDRPRWTSAVRR